MTMLPDMPGDARRWIVATFSLALLAACGGDGATNTATTAPGSAPASGAADELSGVLHVFAATSLTNAFTDIEAAFERVHPDVDVVTNFAGSSALVTQITEGAPADVFASADTTTMAKLSEAGGAAGEPIVFATNRSEIVVAPGNPLGIDAVDDLTGELILVVCSPEVPCGSYATEIFANAGVTPEPDSLEENVGAVITKITSGEADAGIVYATDVIAAGDAAEGIEIPAELNVVAEYPITATTGAANPDAATAFLAFVAGADGQAILATYGFTAP